ncbi:MAG: Gfo/Idh/MocA family oxidoreductase [Verrucomicrobia bacterium]|nr:Gfo/Idh/MocA family oxidoreductase [Verrucomicrobiota bacterium]
MIAVIGAGNWGRNLVRTFSGMDALSAVAEASDELRAKLAEDYPDLNLHADYAELLDSDEIKAVAIATPAPTHHAVAKAFLEAGKDVFVEKPMTMTAVEAEDLIEIADKNDRVLMVGHLLMYQPAIEKIKELIDERAVGDVFTIHQDRKKLGRARKVENVLWSFGVHDVAVLLHLVGDAPIKVDAFGHSGLQPELGIEDDVYLHLGFASGVQAHLHNSWLWPENRRCLTIVGSEGVLVYNEIEQTVKLHRQSIDSETLDITNEGEEIVHEGAKQPLEIELAHFLNCIETREIPKSDGRSGLEVIRVLEKAKIKD